MDSTEIERLSGPLLTLPDRKFTGTREVVDIRRRAGVLEELFTNFDKNSHYIIESGSHGEGCFMMGSDVDRMMVDRYVTVVYPDQCVPPNMAHKTILYMREADCRPGYVNLQLGQRGQNCDRALLNSLVRIEDSTFVSSDIYREECVSVASTRSGLKYESNGPSSTIRTGVFEMDIVYCFPCSNWPKEANEWITRTRLYGWPSQTLIDKIVHSGCHLVSVGDKCSEDTLLQWRISFATAEKSLVHSFSHIQFQVYCLLKYFLKQIKETLKETIGDDDILCSYFLKTIIFHAIENSSKMLWQDINLLYCFWFCFNILIAWVRAGFCPNYFIPGNNLFQRKVHGQHQQVLMDILNHFCQMKWMCLSVGNFFKPSIWERLCNTSTQAQLVCPKTAQEIVINHDLITVSVLPRTFQNVTPPLRIIRKLLHLLSTSQSDFDEVYTYHYAMKGLKLLATENVYPDHTVATDNKTRYRSLKKCKRWTIPSASMGTELLDLATFHFLTGNFSKSLEMSKQTMKLASYHKRHTRVSLPPELEAAYIQEYRQSGHTLDRLRKIFTGNIKFDYRDLYLPHICLELSKKQSILFIPPLPYASFLSFLCCHELGDTRGRDAALHQLIEVQNDDEQGGHTYWIVHTLLGICYQTLGDNHMAIKAYWESAQSKTVVHEMNPAIYRIAVVYLCMYVSQRSDRE